MCGICGELRFDNVNPERDRIHRMMQKLERRGPDSGGSFFDGPVGLGHRRLAIIDLSDKAAQPMVDKQSGLALVFNGTIYNYPELRKELQSLGHTFKSSGDTEVILKAYAEWGEDCLQRLHGMFAFAIHDKKNKRLLLARDRTGIKPLYFSQTGERLLFASTTQALLAGDRSIDTGIDAFALHNLFTLHAVVPAPHTILKGIRKVRPAHYMVIHENGSVEEKRYWSLTARRPQKDMDENDWAQAIHDALRTSVERRLNIADVPVGVLLSGGIDSSLLVGLLSEAGAKGLKTFSVGFEDQPEEKGNEFEYSDAVAEHFNTEHHRFLVPNSEVLPRLPEAFSHMTEPMFGQDAVAFYLCLRLYPKRSRWCRAGRVRMKYSVVISGIRRCTIRSSRDCNDFRNTILIALIKNTSKPSMRVFTAKM